MKTHSLVQGSPEWMAHRAQFFNASDAPAMLGCSPYKTRTQLLHEMHTGLTPDVDAGLQRRFDDGHRFEALARPLGEKIIGETLYPVVGSSGKYSASFDGLTMAEDTAFEHKTLNDELRACMECEDESDHLPMHYRVQMEQQCMVSGAIRVLFMASKWEGDQLVEERHCWYPSDMALAEQIDAGWEQFAIDLAAYVPAEVLDKPTGKTMESLPALRVEVTGMVTASNIDAFKAHALAVFKVINRELTTDQQFADAEKTVKWCGEVEERLAAAKQHALSQTETIDALFRAIDDISAEARRVRLDLDKLVKARKESIRGEIVAEGVKALAQHIDALNARLGKPYMPTVPADFGGAIKGKRTVESLRDAVNTTLANAKIAASATADKIDANLKTLRELAKDHAFLFADTAQIVLKAPDDCTALVKMRIADHHAAEDKRQEAERERIRNEELARIEREQAAVNRAAEAVIAQSAAPAPAANVVQMPTPQESASRILAARLPEVQKAPPTLKLGMICERLGFTVTADFLKTLGFEPAARDKSALLFHESDFPLICMRLVAHIQGVQAKQAA